MKDIFLYQGYHFKPYKQLEEHLFNNDNIYQYLVKDFDLGLIKSYNTFNYDIFYKVANAENIDVFLCIENNTVYMPCDEGLFIYIGPL